MAKLSSYTIVDFPTKEQLNLFLKYVKQRNNYKIVIEEIKEAGLIKRIDSQIWNVTNAYRIDITYEYKDEESFTKFQTVLKDFLENSEIKELLAGAKISSSRGLYYLKIIFKFLYFNLKKLILNLTI